MGKNISELAAENAALCSRVHQLENSFMNCLYMISCEILVAIGPCANVIWYKNAMEHLLSYYRMTFTRNVGVDLKVREYVCDVICADFIIDGCVVQLISFHVPNPPEEAAELAHLKRLVRHTQLQRGVLIIFDTAERPRMINYFVPPSSIFEA